MERHIALGSQCFHTRTCMPREHIHKSTYTSFFTVGGSLFVQVCLNCVLRVLAEHPNPNVSRLAQLYPKWQLGRNYFVSQRSKSNGAPVYSKLLIGLLAGLLACRLPCWLAGWLRGCWSGCKARRRGSQGGVVFLLACPLPLSQVGMAPAVHWVSSLWISGFTSGALRGAVSEPSPCGVWERHRGSETDRESDRLPCFLPLVCL